MAADAIKQLQQLQEVIRKTDESQLKEKVYVCVANGCILLTAYLNSNGQQGWSARLIDTAGQPVLNGNEQKTLEGILEKAPWVIDFFKGNSKIVQTGGGLNDIDISLDEGLNYIIETTEKTDRFWEGVESNSFGNIKKFMDADQIIPTPIGPLPIKARLLSKLLITLLDFLRLASSRAGHSSIPLTLIVFLEELVTGQWRQMILTAASLFITPSGVATSIMIKYVIMAWLNIGGNERTRLVKDIFKGTKSFIRNFLIWCFAILTPGPIKSAMFGIQMPKMPKMPQLPKIPKIPKIQRGGNVEEVTYDVIQEKLKILDNPALLCSPPGKDLVKEVKSDPILGLVAELFDIPSPETLDKVCPVAVTMNSFDDAEAEATELSDIELSPEVPEVPEAAEVPEEAPAPAPVPPEVPPQSGGRKSKKMNKRKPIKKSRKHGHRRH